MNFVIVGPGATKAADKTKKTAAKTAAGGAVFASLLDGANAAAEAPLPTTAGQLAAPYVPLDNDDPPPRNTKEQAHQLLKTLQQLAEDAMAGEPAHALQNLQRTLNANLPDRANLNAAQTQVLNELETRAAVEEAKLNSPVGHDSPNKD
jgi:hypothetical protein